MQPDYDILITGAGPAGCAAAFDLAHAGLRVLLLDKRSFPRHKACACGLTRKTLAALRYSVAPITERVCHEIILQPAYEPDARPPHRSVRVRTRTPICAMAVRSRFDAFCLTQTLAAGRNGGAVTLRKIDTLLALRQTPTHIELDIAFRTPTGALQTETLTAPVLVGADGSNGQTRRLANQLAGHASSQLADQSGLKGTGFSPSVNTSGLEGGFSPLLAGQENGALAPEGPPTDPAWYERGFALEATVPYAALPATLPAGDAPHDLIFDFSPIPGGYGWLFPKGDHINIGVGAFAPRSASAPGAPHLDAEMWVPTDLKAVTRQLLLDYTHQKLGLTHLDHITGQYLGMGGHAYIPRGRVLLTGDAAGLVDPLTGEGIHSAIVSGQAAAAAILETLPTPAQSPREAPPAPSAVAAAYAHHLRPLQQTLAFSHRAAQAFYKQPERGFKAMRIPILRNLILKTYADGIPHTRLLTALAKLV